MKIKIQFKHLWSFWMFAIILWFIVALPFTIVCMTLVSDSPFWMWQSIFMFFGGILFITKD